MTRLGLIAPNVFQACSEDCYENSYLGPKDDYNLILLQCLHMSEEECM